MKSVNKELNEIIGAVKKYLETEEISSGGAFGDIYLKSSGKMPKETGSISSSLETWARKVSVCDKCDLCEKRTRAVFGAGNVKAELMFVGEAPGMEEDIQGLPFVGRAGQLLTKIIESIGLKRKDVYITNVVKCRPPDNRNPMLTEILACEGYLDKQLELIKPKIICCLGKFAAQTLLRSQEPITRLRGKFYDWHDAKLMPTYHPAYLLRNPQDKRIVWEDMKKIREELQSL